MAKIVSVQGAGTRGSAGILSQNDDATCIVEIRFDADPWQVPPASKGAVTIDFNGQGPKRAIALDGAAVLDPHLGNPSIIQWTFAVPPMPGDRLRISLS